MLQVTGVETHPSLRQTHGLLRRQQSTPHLSYPQSSYGPLPTITATHHFEYDQPARKRSRPPNEISIDLQGLGSLAAAGQDITIELNPQGHHTTQGQSIYQTQSPLSAQPQHHHHRLPNQQPPSKLRRADYGDSSLSPQSHGPPSVVGQEGMPLPAPRPRGPKLKFTPEDDQLLVDLKEKKNLTWKQIADFFPGRSSGTLQVRYCTKLKAKTTVWTEEMVSQP